MEVRSSDCEVLDKKQRYMKKPLMLGVGIPGIESDELVEGTFAVGLNRDDMLFFFGAGFKQQAAFVGMIVVAGKSVGIFLIRRGGRVGAIENLP
jgi:hypothetical protein